MSQFHEVDRTRSLVGYVDPTRICKTQHTAQMRADCLELKDKTPKEREEYISCSCIAVFQTTTGNQPVQILRVRDAQSQREVPNN